MAGTSWRLLRVMVVLIWKRTPTLLAVSVALWTVSNAPSVRRNASCVRAVAPSRENDRAITPASFRAANEASSMA